MMLFTAKRIIQRREPRKIILVLTDGEPYSGNPILQRAVVDHLIDNLYKIHKAGIECIAIGIAAEYVRRFFQDSIVVHELSELPKAFYTKFSELLKKTRR